jgi:hypothetical protein
VSHSDMSGNPNMPRRAPLRSFPGGNLDGHPEGSLTYLWCGMKDARARVPSRPAQEDRLLNLTV